MEKARQAVLRFLASDKAQKAAVIALFIVFGFFLVQISNNIVKNRMIDFTTYGISTNALINGQSPYDTGSPYRYIYPVFFTFIFIPITVLPYPVQVLLWYFLGLIALYYSLFIPAAKAAPSLGIKTKQDLIVPLAALAVFFLPYLQHNFVNGESNAFILLFCVLFFKYFDEGKMIPAALFLALGISIKLVPLIFLPFILYRRRLDCFFLTLLFTVLMLLSPVLITGNRIFEYYRYYWDNFIMMETGISAVFQGREMFFTTPKMIGWLFPENRISHTALLLAGVFINGIILLSAEILNTVKKAGKQGDIWLFNIYLIVMLMTMPKSQYHHLIFMSTAAAMLFIKIIYNRKWFNALSFCGLGFFAVLFYAGKIIRSGPYFYLFLLILLAGAFAALYRAGEEKNEQNI